MESTFSQGLLDSFPAGYSFESSEYQPGSELLILLRKYCTKETFLFTGKQEGEVYQYYQRTMAMLDEELKHENVSLSRTYTIMSNLMLVAANRFSLNKNKNHESSMFVTTDQDSKYLMQLIGKRWKIEDRARKAQRHKNPAYTKNRKMIKRILITGASLLSIGGIGSAVNSFHFFSAVKNLSVKEKGFTHRVGDWWKYSLLRRAVPVSNEEIQANRFRSIAIGLFCTLGLILLVAFLLWLNDRWIQKRDAEAEKDWLQYQYLERVGVLMDNCLREDYNGWN